jgi:hypothetical protein
MFNQDSVPPHEQTTLRDNHSRPTQAAWPPPPRPRGRKAFPSGAGILLATLALTLVVGGLGFIVFTASTQYKVALHTQATAQARSTAHANATMLALTQQVTAQALATQQTNIYATATGLAGSTATALSNGDTATATANTLQNLLNQDSTGTPALNDALGDNSGNNHWDEIINSEGNTGCQFNNGVYHALESLRGFLQPCFAGVSNFSNCVYQVTMTINQGDQGGIIFRATSGKAQYYLFRIGTDSSYTLERYNNNQLTTLSNGFNAAIAQGGQSNTLSVIADKSKLYLFANQTYIATATDTTFTSGQIGVVALDFTLPTDVEFSNAQVWTL